MQAVILAAGRGTRMGILTETVPKPMLMFCGKNLLEHKMDALPDEITEVIMVIGYLGNKIKEYFGNSYRGRTITYIEQTNLSGTGPALFETRSILKNNFLVMMGDDIYSASDIKNILQHPWALLTSRVDRPGKGAKILLDKDHRTIINIIENADVEKGDLVNNGLYSLGKEIFNYGMVSIGCGEFGLPQMVALACKDFDIKIEQSRDWRQVTRSEDLLG